MAEYFEISGWEPVGPGETPNSFLRLLTFLRAGTWEEIAQDKKIPPPASKEVVEQLQEKEVTDVGSQCPVCLKGFEVGECLKVLPCKHAYHGSCILPWLAKTSTCPLCRHELPTDDEEYENYKKQKSRAEEYEEE